MANGNQEGFTCLQLSARVEVIIDKKDAHCQLDHLQECIHFVVENSGFPCAGGWNQVLINDGENVIANLGKLLFHLVPIVLDALHIFLIALALLLLLNGRHDPP